MSHLPSLPARGGSSPLAAAEAADVARLRRDRWPGSEEVAEARGACQAGTRQVRGDLAKSTRVTGSVGEEARGPCKPCRVTTTGGTLASVPPGKAPRHFRRRPGGGLGVRLLAVCASCPANTPALLPADASPEVPRHQAQQSQLAAAWGANGLAGQPICSALPAACLWDAGRQPVQVVEVPAPGPSRPAGKLARLAGIPICRLVPGEGAGEWGPGTWGSPGRACALAHSPRELLRDGGRKLEGHEGLGTQDSQTVT